VKNFFWNQYDLQKKTFNPGRLARDQLPTSSHANINRPVTHFYKTHATYYCIAKNTESARAAGEFKGLF